MDTALGVRVALYSQTPESPRSTFAKSMGFSQTLSYVSQFSPTTESTLEQVYGIHEVLSCYTQKTKMKYVIG